MPGLVGPDAIREVADAALELSGVDGVEVLLMHEWGGLTRFASSSIHQSTWREDTGLRVRVVSKDRIGVAATNDLSPRGARVAAASAKEMAEVVSPDPLFPGLAPKADVPEKDAYDEATGAVTPEDRAEGVAALVGQCADGFHAAGSYETTALEIALANSEGQFCYQPSTQASVTALVSGGAAVATLIAFLAYMGFGGRALTEGRSCLSGKRGERVASPLVSIADDALAPGSPGPAFDFEGTPKRRVDIIKDGVFIDGVYDRRSARQAERESTGHALPPPNPDGPFPLNLVVANGESTLDEMVGATQRGLLVTRFHYSNIVHPTLAVITGMTRDGTWLVEDGEVKHPVKNFRFTQSILEALANTEMVSKETEMVSEFFFAASRVPALRVNRFHFTGRSDH